VEEFYLRINSKEYSISLAFRFRYSAKELFIRIASERNLNPPIPKEYFTDPLD
jgi:hypothetical protein